MAIARAGGDLAKIGTSDWYMASAASSEWQSGLSRLGLSGEQKGQLADYWDNHDFFKSMASFGTKGLATNLRSSRTTTINNNPIAYHMDRQRHDQYANTIDYTNQVTQRQDQFEQSRAGYLRAQAAKNKNAVDPFAKYAGTQPTMANMLEYQNAKRQQLKGTDLVGFGTKDGVSTKTFRSGKTETGRILGGAYISDKDYAGLSDTERKWYGKTWQDAQQQDQGLSAASKLLEGGIGYRNMKNRQSGIGKKIGGLIAPALTAIGALTGQPWMAAFGGAFQGAQSGGGLAGILKGGGLGYLGGKLASGGFGGSKAATSASNLTQQGGNNMSFWDTIKNVGSNLLDSVGDLFGGGGGGLDNILSTGMDIIFGGGDNSGPGGKLLSNLGKGYVESRGAQEARSDIRQGSKEGSMLADPFQRHRAQYAGRLNSLMKNPMATLQQDPSYRFRLNQGLKATQRAAEAGGMAKSGNALIAAQEYGSKFASQEFQSAFDRLGVLSGGTSGQMGTSGNLIAGAGGNLANIVQGKYEGYGNIIGADAPQQSVSSNSAGVGMTIDPYGPVNYGGGGSWDNSNFNLENL